MSKIQIYQIFVDGELFAENKELKEEIENMRCKNGKIIRPTDERSEQEVQRRDNGERHSSI